MAKNTSRYVQFYTPGSVACKVEIRQEREWAPLPAAKPKPTKVIPVDPVAILGFLMAIGMLVLMAIGINHINTTPKHFHALPLSICEWYGVGCACVCVILCVG